MINSLEITETTLRIVPCGATASSRCHTALCGYWLATCQIQLQGLQGRRSRPELCILPGYAVSHLQDQVSYATRGRGWHYALQLSLSMKKIPPFNKGATQVILERMGQRRLNIEPINKSSGSAVPATIIANHC